MTKDYMYLATEIKQSPTIRGCLNMLKTAIREDMPKEEIFILIDLIREKVR